MAKKKLTEDEKWERARQRRLEKKRLNEIKKREKKERELKEKARINASKVVFKKTYKINYKTGLLLAEEITSHIVSELRKNVTNKSSLMLQMIIDIESGTNTTVGGNKVRIELPGRLYDYAYEKNTHRIVYNAENYNFRRKDQQNLENFVETVVANVTRDFFHSFGISCFVNKENE